MVAIVGDDRNVMESLKIETWRKRFPPVAAMPDAEFARISQVVRFPVLDAGQVAYEQGGACENYLMCIEGRTRITKMNAGGREILLYKVEEGGTCVLTTQCLLSRTDFPAESVAETRTELAAIPSVWFHRFMADIPAFRDFVIADYTKLLGTMLSFVDDVAFATVEQRLARRLLVEAGETPMVARTHHQLALDIGSVREIVSRHLGDWERNGWVRNGRGQIRILDRAALASRRSQ
ncbi:Crp/Fnr family transcriptional regulator [Beijerinckia sp. L45]|uniref:Crp/Fnr family transcriptional regulator n=1 Tax=Beijerinckia sp. L45 TaxID=1641855 RepID=UPI001FEF4174|nr:Crp/Fnr family transcriptional regulator [Beijerinckia sp. L45]